MSLELTFEITFESDYHVGAGYGKGFGVDSALLREADGRPVLRGSALAGSLRGSVYRLLKLSPMRKHSCKETLQRLFGNPEQEKRWYISSAHPVTSQAEDAYPVQRVRIDPRTRRAEPRKLFSQENGIAGQAFRFTVTCPQHDESALDEAALWVAAARYTRHLGRSRRRGLGECTIHLTYVDGVIPPKPADQSWEDWFLDRFNQKWLQGNPADRPTSEAKANVKAISTFGGKLVRVRIIIRLDEPLLIAERALAGNQFDARPSIPGRTLLGVLANLAAQRCDLSRPDEYRDFVALFLRGGVIFPTLYPAYHYSDHLYPTIPAPLGLMTCSVVPFEGESEGHGAFPADGRKECPHCKNKLEAVSGFVILRRQAPFTYVPGRSSELHIRVKEETQRVEKGQLYGYTVLDAGQYFVGELLCPEDAWTRLQEMTGIVEKRPLTWRIGKARRRGYGRVTAWLERYDDSPQTWIQVPLEERVPDVTQPLTLTLLTDTIITDTWGRQATGFAAEWLEPVLGLGPVKVLDAYARTRVIDGFNATLGLPRWRDTALVAGSVAWIRLLKPPDDWQTHMVQLEEAGIGLRRNEGFGRIAFNHSIYNQREEFTESAIWLQEPMRLGRGLSKDPFVKQWEEELEKHLPSKQCLDPRFAAVARWLHTHSDQAPESLRRQLDTLGQPDSALIEALDEYGSRSKANFFQTTDGKPTVEAIGKALQYLQEEEPQHWPHGIKRLADWLAAMAADKKGEAK